MKPSLHAVDTTAPATYNSMSNPAMIGHRIVAEAFLDAFHRRVGVGRGKQSIPDVADALDVNPRTVKAWYLGEALPQLTQTLRLCCLFGPAFTSEILEPVGQGEVERIVQATERRSTDIAAALVRAANDLLERSHDGTLSARDRAAMAPRLHELSRELAAQARAMAAPNDH